MIKGATVEGGIVTNIIVIEAIEDLGIFDAVACPEEVQIGWTYDGGVFSAPAAPAPSLAELKAGRIVVLTGECAGAIVGGYLSAALGDVFAYPSGINDQINMMGSVTASLLPGLGEDWSTPFWCADAEGQWSFRPHTVAEIQTAGSDGKAHIVTCQETLSQLSIAVMTSTTAEAVQAITWPESL